MIHSFSELLTLLHCSMDRALVEGLVMLHEKEGERRKKKVSWGIVMSLELPSISRKWAVSVTPHISTAISWKILQ